MEVLNPVTIEKETIKTLNSISSSIRPVSEAYDKWQTAKLEHKRQFALAYRQAEGSIKDREQEATEKTISAAEAEKDAEVLYKYLLDHQRSYRDKLSAFQTLAKSVNAAYGAAGAG